MKLKLSTMSNHPFSGVKNISVLGASGKMGRGIVLLFARSILRFNLKHQEKRQIFAFDIVFYEFFVIFAHIVNFIKPKLDCIY